MLLFPLAISLSLGAYAPTDGCAQKNSTHRKTLTVGERLAADLTWSQAERDHRFAHMDRLFPVHIVPRGGRVLPLPAAGIAALNERVRTYTLAEHLAGVLVLQDGKIIAEQYGLGLTPSTRWTSFSMTKAVTDALVGIAVKRGELRSIEADVTDTLPEMRGSAYDGVTVRQLMTMTSGVRWDENYTRPDADNVLLYTTAVAPGKNGTVEYMRRLKRDAAPGSRWHYNTGETDLLGVLLVRATGHSLAAQLSAAVWQRAGMERSATWIATATGRDGYEFGGSGLSATLRDFGRLGLWVLRDGDGAEPEGWMHAATGAQVSAGGAGYGYGWWPQPDGGAAALGIFGQSMLVDPGRKLVVVTLGSWTEATGRSHTAARAAFWQDVRTALQNEPR